MLFINSIFIFSCVAFSIVTALPYQQPDTQKILTESLTEYYESIVDQTMYDVSEDALFYIPEALSDGNTEARQHAGKALCRNLNFIRASLLASIHPLVLTDTSLMKGFDSIQQKMVLWAEEDPLLKDSTQDDLLDFIFSLNERISYQLGLIVNAKESSRLLIKQAAHQLRNSPRVVTIERNLRKPSQVHLATEKVSDRDLSVETQWLYQELVTVQDKLLIDFNEQTDEFLQIIKDTFAFGNLD